MTAFNFIVCVIFLIGLVYNLYMLYRNNRVFENRIKVLKAIWKYQVFCIESDLPIKVDCDDLEEYDETLYKRPFDFSCEHILPKEKYEIIKEFM